MPSIMLSSVSSQGFAEIPVPPPRRTEAVAILDRIRRDIDGSPTLAGELAVMMVFAAGCADLNAGNAD